MGCEQPAAHHQLRQTEGKPFLSTMAVMGIAAIALQEDMTLITSNDKHFRRVVDLGYPLRLENWRNP